MMPRPVCSSFFSDRSFISSHTCNAFEHPRTIGTKTVLDTCCDKMVQSTRVDIR
jgi:hypothetical protein